MKRMRLAIVFSLLINVLPVACFSQAQSEETDSFSALADKSYFIAPGDIISINVFPAEEFSRSLTVQPDGTIEVPLLGSVKVEGLSALKLQNILIAKFSKYVSNPSVTVNIRKFASNRVAVIGEVIGAGYYGFTEGMRILDLIAQAGGFKDYARLKKVRIFRTIKGAEGKIINEIVRVDMARVMDGDMYYNEELLSGDVIYIPRKRFSKTTRWIADNILPWLTVITFGVVISDRTK